MFFFFLGFLRKLNEDIVDLVYFVIMHFPFKKDETRFFNFEKLFLENGLKSRTYFCFILKGKTK